MNKIIITLIIMITSTDLLMSSSRKELLEKKETTEKHIEQLKKEITNNQTEIDRYDLSLMTVAGLSHLKSQLAICKQNLTHSLTASTQELETINAQLANLSKKNNYHCTIC